MSVPIDPAMLADAGRMLPMKEGALNLSMPICGMLPRSALLASRERSSRKASLTLGSRLGGAVGVVLGTSGTLLLDESPSSSRPTAIHDTSVSLYGNDSLGAVSPLGALGGTIAVQQDTRPELASAWSATGILGDWTEGGPHPARLSLQRHASSLTAALSAISLSHGSRRAGGICSSGDACNSIGNQCDGSFLVTIGTEHDAVQISNEASPTEGSDISFSQDALGSFDCDAFWNGSWWVDALLSQPNGRQLTHAAFDAADMCDRMANGSMLSSRMMLPRSNGSVILR